MATVVDRSVVVYGQDIYYQEVGAGPTVILLHAAGADGAEWSEVIGPLAARYRVVTPDLVGHGQSGKPSLAYRIGTLADFLAGFLDALGLDRADLVGHSASGAAAATVALRHPARVGRLVLVDAGYAYAVPAVADPRQLGHTPGSLRLLSPATYEDARQLFALATHRPPAPGEVATFFAGSMASAYATGRLVESFARREDVLDGLLGGLAQPTLVVWGREDGITPAALGERMVREIPGARLVVVEGCGHAPNAELPDAFNAAVLEFLAAAHQGDT